MTVEYNFEDMSNFTTERRRKLRETIYNRLEEYGSKTYSSYIAVLRMIGIRFGFEIEKYRLDERTLRKSIAFLDIILPTHK